MKTGTSMGFGISAAASVKIIIFLSRTIGAGKIGSWIFQPVSLPCSTNSWPKWIYPQFQIGYNSAHEIEPAACP
jgi:hypothetical protein